MKYIILHNIHDKLSRDFVANLPNKQGDEYEVIDWYGDEGARFSYLGPPASAFPSVSFESESEYFIVRAPESWKEVDEAVKASSEAKRAPKLSSCNKDEYIGGQTVEELKVLVDECPHYFKVPEEVRAKIEVVKERKDGKEIKNLAQAPPI